MIKPLLYKERFHQHLPEIEIPSNLPGDQFEYRHGMLVAREGGVYHAILPDGTLCSGSYWDVFDKLKIHMRTRFLKLKAKKKHPADTKVTTSNIKEGLLVYFKNPQNQIIHKNGKVLSFNIDSGLAWVLWPGFAMSFSYYIDSPSVTSGLYMEKQT